MFEVDVVIAGGGPAGCATAAAIAELGHSVLLADAGVDRHRQLAGELVHPVGVEDLRALGFGAVLEGPQAQEVVGFAVVDARATGLRTALLPYEGADRGLALEHAALTLPLLDALTHRERITVLQRTRVQEIHRNDAEGIELTLAREGGTDRVRARWLVAADGRSSPVRKLLGIAEGHQHLSSMLGVTVEAAYLPYPGHGHLFVGGPAPVLAYAISERTARVMIDLPSGSRPPVLREQPQLLGGVPEPLRAEILAALDREAPRMASNDTRLPAAVAVGRAALVGDAAGCCHPLSASGLASCARDARELQAALRSEPDDICRALQLYARRRRPAQRTRIALASALYRAFTGRGTDMEALRTGLFRYWQRSRNGARSSMALLSTREPRMWVMAREYTRVVRHGLAALASEAADPRGRRLGLLVRAGRGLVASAWPHLRDAIRGALEGLGALLRAPAHVPAKRDPLAPNRAPASRS